MQTDVLPPASGAMTLNRQVVAEQIGAQIFVEGFAMTHPNDPKTTADLAEQAARINHDNKTIHAAQIITTLVAHSFVESDINRLLDTTVTLIPKNSLIYQIVADIQN